MKEAITAKIVGALVSVGRGMFGSGASQKETAAGTITAALVAGLVALGVPEGLADNVADGVTCAAGEVVEYHEDQQSAASSDD
jgi:hypothetical protein